MVASYRAFLVSVVVAGLFVLAMFNFGYEFSIENSANQTILDDPRLSNLNSTIVKNLSASRDTVNNQNSNIEDSEVTIGNSIILAALTGTWKVFSGSIIGFMNIFTLLARDILGVPAVALGTVLSVIGITTLFLGWRFLRLGA